MTTTEPTKALLTATGSPGSAALIKALQASRFAPVDVSGVDMSPHAIGAQLVDDFETVPAAADSDFIVRLGEVAERIRPDVLLPQSSAEIGTVARSRSELESRFGGRVMVDNADTVETLENKWELANSLKSSGADFIPATHLCHNAAEIRTAAIDLGFPHRRVCVKPADAKGTRGFRLFCSPLERADAIMNGRPDDPRITLDQYCEAVEVLEANQPVLVMEFVEGHERTVDVYCENGKVLVGFVKTREGMRNGLAMHFEVVESPGLWDSSRSIVDQFSANYFLNIQFKGSKLLEVNPRVSTFVWDYQFNMPLLGVLHASGRLSSTDLESVAGPTPGVTARRFYDQTHALQDGPFFELPDPLQ